MPIRTLIYLAFGFVFVGCDQDLDIGALDASTDAAVPLDAENDGGGGCTTCDTPPDPICVGDMRRTFGAGRCVDDSCEYEQMDAACTDGCVDGECGESPCAGVVCDEPPQAVCASGDTLRVFDLGGACEDGLCTYGARELTCDHGCADGACVADLCEGVACNMPPGACHEGTGNCVDGACEYALRPATAVCDDGDACTVDDVCGTGECRGTALRCDSPPPSTCVDAATVREFAPVGVCGGGECTYAPTDRTCAFGCQDGGCAMDPCDGVSCTMPPTPTACYAATGSCMGGDCAYTPIDDVACNDGDPCTVFDSCDGGLCSGTPLRCDTPPPASCADDTTRRTFGAGTCGVGGVCEYTPVDVSCGAGEVCRLATCVDRCSLQSPLETLATSDDLFAPSVAYDAAGDRTLIAWADVDEDEVWVAVRDASGAIVSRREVAQYRPTELLTVVGQASIVADTNGSALMWVERDLTGGSFGNYSLRYVAWDAMDVETERLRFGPSPVYRSTEVRPRLFSVGGVRIAAYLTLSTDALPIERLVFRRFGDGAGVIFTTEHGTSDGVCVDGTQVYSVWGDSDATLRILDTDGALVEMGRALHRPDPGPGALRCAMTDSGLMLAVARTVWRVDGSGALVGAALTTDQRIQGLVPGNGEVLAVGGGSTFNTEVYRLREDATRIDTRAFGVRSARFHPEGAAYGMDWTLSWQGDIGDDTAVWASLCE